MKFFTLLILFLCFELFGCIGKENKNHPPVQPNNEKSISHFDSTYKTIHIFVALCDNKYQGIVPVPAKIGNGQDTDNNLYWGCKFGVRSYFKNSKEWKFIKAQKIDKIKHERIIFKHISKKYFLVADAYDGQYIKQCIDDFLLSSCGKLKDTLRINNITLGISGNSELVGYIGHNGPMDFQLHEEYKNTDNKKRDVVILACFSKLYFSHYLENANVNPLVWSTGLMSPEAYTILDAITGYINGETNEMIRRRATTSYSNYQKCSKKAAMNLLVTGW